MTTYSQLLNSYFIESVSRHNRYWKSSSLNKTEKLNNKPKDKRYRRDKVLRNICKIQMESARLKCEDAFEGFIDKLKGE